MPILYRYENHQTEIPDSAVCDLCGKKEPITDLEQDIPKGYTYFMVFTDDGEMNEILVCGCLEKKAYPIYKYLKGDLTL